MSADDEPMLELDLTDWDGTVPEDWKSEFEEEDGGAPAEDGDRLPGDFDDWTIVQREEWAFGDNDLRGSVERARRRLYSAWLTLHPEADIVHNGRAALTPSLWADVPLDGILDSIAAGTLVLPTPTVGMLADGSAGLFYSGRVNGLAGESGAGKGWIALTAGLEQMTLGMHVYYLDFEDSAALALLRLVKILRAPPALVRQHFHYVHPAGHDAQGIEDLVERVASVPGALVIIDSTGESIAAAGWNQNHDEDVAAWFQSLAHPLADKGKATVLLLDHMVKSEDGGLWPIGSQRKRAAITGAQYVAEVGDPFSKTKNGMVALRVAKDRHGAREAKSVASYVQFQHPIASMTTLPDGTTDVLLGEELEVVFGVGKSADKIKADKDAKAAAALDADVAALDNMTPPPKSQRDVQGRMSWGGARSMAALREWRVRQRGRTS